MIRPAETFKFRRVRAAGEGWLPETEGEGLRRAGDAAGEGRREEWGGAEPPGAAGVKDPCGRGGVPLVLKPQLSPLGSFLLCPGLKIPDFFVSRPSGKKCNNSENL